MTRPFRKPLRPGLGRGSRVGNKPQRQLAAPNGTTSQRASELAQVVRNATELSAHPQRQLGAPNGAVNASQREIELSQRIGNATKQNPRNGAELAEQKRQGESRRNGAEPQSGAAVGAAYQANLGHQLSRRVGSGAIDQEQAERTAGQRRELAKAYGADWRQHLYGGEDLHALRLAASRGDMGSKKRLGELMNRRKRLLTRAQEGTNGGVASGEAQ